jgi:hypothetical protein
VRIKHVFFLKNGDVMSWRVTVAGWEWCQSIEESESVRMVPVRVW